MTLHQAILTATTALLAVLAALEHVPVALARVLRACRPLVTAWRELRPVSSSRTEPENDAGHGRSGDRPER